MRFLRLRIANYRGIDACEVKFGSPGITLIQGPNEAGKTSLSEAIGILFEYPDSSKHRNVEAIKPVHRDEGPEIELEVESGPYAFTYYKRFYKKPETKLTVTRPNPENHTGREAHERAEAILRETLDIDLWKALTIQQGDEIHQPDLTKQTSLSAALDRVAGGRPADPRQEDLFDRVREEYSRYFTDRGAEKKDLQEARKLQTDTQAEISGIEAQICDLEHDIERSAALQRELEQLKKQEDEQGKAVDSYTAALEELTKLENDLLAARLKLESAEKSEQAARRDKEARQSLIDAAANAAREHGELQESCEMYLPSLNQAEEEFKKAQATFSKADERRKEADNLADLRRADFDYYNNKLHLEQLRERKKRIDAARKNAAKAEEELALNKVTPRTLNAILEAEQASLGAKAQMQIGAPSIHLRGLTKSKLEINGTTIVLGKDEVRTMPVADRVQITIPGELVIEAVAGASTEKLSRKVVEAEHVLETACKKAGVDNPEEARIAFDQRREAERHVKSREEIEKDNLRDLTYEELEKKLTGLARTVPDYIAKRVQKPELSPDLESAKKERANAEGNQQKTNEAWEAARESLDATRKLRDKISAKHQEIRIQFEMLAKDLNRARENLDRARKASSDDLLEVKLAESARLVSAQESNVRSAEESLKAKNPERVKALCEAARGSLQTTRNRRAAAQTELTEVHIRLKIHGEEGLHEKVIAAQSRMEHIERNNLALFRRATAVRLLFETMREERDKARRAYVAPLKEKIEHLGRLVFDESFQVEISEELQIASRTAHGVTVPFDSLSGGTREQLSLIFRLACSMIVAKDGGTPLILDDALGYTDPERLRLMGAVLAKAAKECQIVVFTCVPDRYSNVGQATVVSLV
jgi:DNA repair exonuclease SbcCD ATPase subunit